MSSSVGTAKVDLTPGGAVVMSGFAARTERSRGVADALEARAIALGGRGGAPPSVMVVVDAIGVDRAFTAALRSRLADAVPAGNVAALATHTHGGPALLVGAFLGEVDAAVREAYLAGAEEAARRAIAAITAAELRFGSVSVPGLARNRRDPAGPVDDELAVLWAVAPDGRVVALLASFALHPVVLGPDNLLLTRDYVGYLVDGLEAAFPGATALFATGCAGQVNHGHGAAASFSLRPSSDRTFRAAREVSERLAAAAAELVRGGGAPLGEEGAVSARAAVRLPLQRSAERGAGAGAATQELLAELERGLAAARLAADAAATALLEPQVRWARRDLRRAPAYRATELMAVGLGDLALVLFPGEPFVEHGLALKSAAASRGRPRKVMTLAYANDAPGYLPTAAAVQEGGYEVDLAYRFYGLPSRYAEGVEARLGRAASRLVEQVTK